MTTQLLIYYSITLAGVVRNALQARVKAWPLAVLLLFIPQLHGQRVPNRYIVELSTEPVADHVTRMHARGGVRGAEADAQRTRVRGEQQSLRARIEQQQAKILDSTNTVANTLFVEVSDKDVAKLKSLPGVKRVTQVRLMHPLLDRAVVLQHVQDAWNRVGADKAGAGAKIDQHGRCHNVVPRRVAAVQRRRSGQRSRFDGPHLEIRGGIDRVVGRWAGHQAR